MVSKSYAEAATEVLTILEHTDSEMVEKIPENFIQLLKNNGSKTYKPDFDYNKDIKDLNLKPKTHEILGVIYLKYWASQKEKVVFTQRAKENEKFFKEEETGPNDKSGIKKLQPEKIEAVIKKKNERDLLKLPQNIKVLLVPTYESQDKLREEGIRPSATVEAEYGEKVIEGEQITLAHHTNEYKDNPAPCNTPNVPILADNSTIVISHLDLDTLRWNCCFDGQKNR